MKKVLWGVLILALLLSVLISGISCIKTVYLPTPTTRVTALDVDLHNVQTAVDSYVLQSGEWPISAGSLPPQGQYALIDFHASFDKGGQTVSFYPQLISNLPRHWDEGVWRIDSAGLVSVDITPDRY